MNAYIDLNKSISLDGGFDCGYSGVAGRTTVNGTLTIIDGTVTIGDFTLE